MECPTNDRLIGAKALEHAIRYKLPRICITDEKDESFFSHIGVREAMALAPKDIKRLFIVPVRKVNTLTSDFF